MFIFAQKNQYFLQKNLEYIMKQPITIDQQTTCYKILKDNLLWYTHDSNLSSFQYKMKEQQSILRKFLYLSGIHFILNSIVIIFYLKAS